MTSPCLFQLSDERRQFRAPMRSFAEAQVARHAAADMTASFPCVVRGLPSNNQIQRVVIVKKVLG